MKKTPASNTDKKPFNPFIVAGVLLLLAALIIIFCNLYQDYQGALKAERAADDLRQVLQSKLSSEEKQLSEAGRGDAAMLPDLADLPMPEVEAAGRACIGLLKIDALSLELPVISQWSYPALKIAPARYAGSAYQDSLVIAGHNYSRHFGRLKTLHEGDTLSFTDMNGNRFDYQVIETEILKPTDTDEMIKGDWDLTLFTCTVGGSSRVTVRCERV